VRAIATQRSVPPAQIALAWLLAKPGISAPIIEATQAHHLDEAAPALEVTLTGDETALLGTRTTPVAVSWAFVQQARNLAAIIDFTAAKIRRLRVLGGADQRVRASGMKITG
jgi:aryl-alcohol dehydrogenase-like predicted oxidoreductase